MIIAEERIPDRGLKRVSDDRGEQDNGNIAEERIPDRGLKLTTDKYELPAVAHCRGTNSRQGFETRPTGLQLSSYKRIAEERIPDRGLKPPLLKTQPHGSQPIAEERIPDRGLKLFNKLLCARLAN